MLRKSGYTNALMLLMCIGLAACSGGGSPVSPELTNRADTTNPRSVADSGPSQVIWGYWSITIDPVTLNAEIVPMRTAEFNANVTIFLQAPWTPVNLIGIDVLGTSQPEIGLFDVDVTLQHPFKSLAQYRGFDVRGIFMADGSLPVESTPGLIRTAPDEARILNSDGYTRWWNAQEFGPEGEIFGFQPGVLGFPVQPLSTLNPYKYFADDLDEVLPVSTLDPTTRGTFANQPGINTRNYLIQFPMNGSEPDFTFQYAVDAAWEEPDESFAPDYPMEAFGPDAQMREPYHITMWDLGSTAWYEGPSDNGGELQLAIEVFDWQTPEMGPSDQISTLYIEGDVINGAINLYPTAIELPGSQVTSRVYSVVTDDLILTQAGDVEVFITAVSAVGTYEPNIPTGGAGWVYPDEPLAAFASGIVNIHGEAPNHPPVAIADNSGPLSGNAPLTVFFDPDGSYDPDPGDYIALYEWDFENDGTFDVSNTDGAIVSHIYTDPGIHEAQLRVTDSFGATDMLDVPLEIELPDIWPMGFYDARNTCYNPHSNVTYPLNLVYRIDHPGNNHSQLTIGRDRIYMIDSGGYLRTYDEATGAVSWLKDIKTTTGGYWTGASAALWENHVITGGTGIWSFDADTGTDDWHMYPGMDFNHQGQVIVDDTIYFKGTGSGFASIEAVDGSQNWVPSWTAQPLFPPVYGEVSGQGYVAAPYSANFRCLNADTGGFVWEQYTGSVYHNAVVVGDYVYYGGSAATLYKTDLSSGVHDATYSLAGYQPLGTWISDEDLFLVGRFGSSTFKLMSFDFDLNLNWEVPILYSCDVGVYSDGLVWLAVRLDGTYMQMVAYDPDDGTQLYAHSEKFNVAWGGITNVNNRLYIADNYSNLLCFESL